MSWNVRVSACRVEGLFDTGSWRDKQDPALTFMLGNEKIGRTKRAKDAGTEAVFTEEFELSLSEEDFDAKELTVRAENIGMIGSSTFISESKQQLSATVPKLNQAISTNMTLMREGKAAGTAFFDIIVSAPPPSTPKSEVAEERGVVDKGGPSEVQKCSTSSVAWKLEIEEMSVKNLHSAGNQRDIQDPCVKVWLNEELLGKTARLKDAGTCGTFPERFQSSITEEVFKTGTLKVEAYNESLFGSLTPIGEGVVKIRDAMPEEDINDEAEVKIGLTFDNKHEGTVGFFLYVDAPNRPVPTPEEVQAKIKRRKDEAASKLAQTKSEKPDGVVHAEGSIEVVDDGLGSPSTGPPGGGDEAMGGESRLKLAKQHSVRGVGKKSSIPFTMGKVHIKALTCSEMADHGSKVFFSIELNNSTQTHETQPTHKKDGICHEEFLGLSMDVERYHVHGGNLTIKYYEKTMFSSRSLVGMNTIELDSLLLHVGDEVNLFANLLDERHTKCGRAVVQLQLEQTNNVDVKPAIEEAFDSAVLGVSAIKLKDLRHTDATFSSAVSKPFVSFTYADAPVYTTAKDSRPYKGGIIFEHLTFEKFDLTPAEVKDFDLHVEVWDKGMVENTLVGTAIIGLDEVRLNQTTSLEADIMKKGEVAGTITVFVLVDNSMTELQLNQRRIQELSPRSKVGEVAKVAELKKKAIEEFPGGVLVIKNVTAKNLPNVEVGAWLGDKIDPFIEFEYCEIKLKTDYQNEAGSSAYFRDLYYALEVKNAGILTSELLKISVFDHNKTGAVLIGSQSVNLSDHILEFDDDADAQTINTNYLCKLRCDLKDKNNQDAGQVVIDCMMKPSEETLKELAVSIDIPSSFEKGVLSIKKILGKDMRANTANDQSSVVHSPYLVFDYCDNSGGGGDEREMAREERTGMQYTSMGSGGDPSWLICSYKQRVTKADLRSKAMTISVRENSGGKKDQSNTNIDDDDVIAVGYVDNMLLAGSQPGQETEVHVELYSPSNDNGGAAASISEKRAGSLGHLTLLIEVLDTTGKEDSVKASPRTGGEEFKFSEGLLCLTYVVAKGLKSGGRPFLSFMIEDAPETEEVLPVLTNAKGDLHWDITSRIPVDIDLLQRKAIILTASEQNTIMSPTVLGHGEASLNFFASASRINKPVELSVQLLDEKGKSIGRIILGAEVRPLDKDIENATKLSFEEDFKGAQVQFFKIQTHNLKNTELFGKADPYIKIIDSDGHDIGKTFTLFDKGGSVLFDYLDIKTSPEDDHLYSKEAIEQKTITIEAWDENTFPVHDKFIGKGVVRLKDLKGPWNREVELPVVPLVDGHGNATGRVHIHAKLVKPPPPKDTPLVFPDKFRTAVAYVRRISGFGIENVNMTAMLGNKADPYITVAYFPTTSSASPIWTNDTAPIMDSGDHALWDYLDMQFPIDQKGMEDGVLLVTAMDKNIGTSDKFIGAGLVSLKRLTQSIVMEEGGDKVAEEGKLVELSVDLTLESAKRNALVKKGGKSNGRVVLHLEVAREQPKEEELIIKHDFEFGTLRVNKVRTFNLKNSEWMSFAGGMQDPYVKLKFADWEDQTHPKEDAGSDALWDFLGMESPIYLENILESKLEVRVWDQNTLRKDVLIGRGEVDIKKAICEPYVGKEIKVTCQLVDDKDVPSGKIEVYLSINEAQMGGTVPDDFDLGVLQVKKALMLGLKGKCPRPTLSFALGEGTEQLERQDFEEGENPCWDMDWRTQINSQIARGAAPMAVTVMTKSFTGHESTFGTAEVEVTEAAVVQNLGKTVQLSTIINDASGKKIGRLVLECCINRDVVKSLPVTDSLPPTFMTGTMILHSLKIRGDQFKNRNIYCRLEHGNWNECTSTSASKSAAVTSWNFGDAGMDDGLLAEVNKESLRTARLRVVIMEEGSTIKGVKELASGALTAKYTAQMCSSLKRKMQVKLDLQESKEGAHVTIGTAELSCTLTDVDMLPDNDDGLPDSSITFKSAILQVKKVAAYDLRGGDVVGKADPFVILSIANLAGEGTDWKAQTPFQEGAGRAASWDSIDDMDTPISRDACLFKRLKVTAFDHNNITKNAVMGAGDIGLRGAGAVPNDDKLLVVQLKDKDQRNAGKVELTVCLVPDVDMTSGLDRDGDGIDDGLEGNKMQGNLDVSCIEWNRGKGWDSEKVYPVVRLGGWKGVGDIRKSEGNQLWQWGTSLTAEKVSSAHIAQQGLRLQFCKASSSNPTSLDNLLGEMKLMASVCLSTLGEWVDLKGDFIHDGEFKGKFSITMRFTPLDESKVVDQKTKIEEQDVKTAMVTSAKEAGPGSKQKPRGLIESQLQGPGRGDEAINEALTTHASKIDAKNAEMEAHLQKQMKKMLATQTAELQRSMEELELKALKLSQKKEEKKSQLDIFSVTNVALPANVNDWKVAHVQAWLAFDVELPAYMDSFHAASIDGHMLVRYVDDKTLGDNLGVGQSMQRKKILDAIEQLKERQEVVERKAEALRKATLRKDKAEEDAELRRIKKEEADALKRTEKKNKQKHHKKSNKQNKKSTYDVNMSATAPQLDKPTMLEASAQRKGTPSEQNQIDRIRLERAARLALIERQKLAAKMERKSGTWKFEYSGSPMPTADDLWGDMTWQTGEHLEEGTKDYQTAMATLDPLSDEGLQQGAYRRKLPRMRILPKRSSGDEVLAAVKECFFDLSSRLLDVQKRKIKGVEHLDDDLLSVEYSVTDEVEDVTNGETAAGSAEGLPSIGAPMSGDEGMTRPPIDTDTGNPSWDKPPSIKEWENDEEKDDYLMLPDAAGADVEETWAAPPPVSEWDSDKSYQQGTNIIEEPQSNGDKQVANVTVPGLAPVAPGLAKSESHVTKKRIHRVVHKHVKERDAQHNIGLSEFQLDRMTLVYTELVHQTNNNAPFIGTNEKLTRLKMLGGLESKCRLKLSWSQFDSMWTKLDAVRTGDLDLQEFKNFFGDLSEFEKREGTNTLTLHSENKAMRELAKCLAEMCDTMRHAGFTVEEMFCCFDRNASGSITPSEFCSLLRLIIGPSFDKKLIYEALMVVDTDHDKTISRFELFMFVYRTWKMQLEEIDYRKSWLNPASNPQDTHLTNEYNKERNLIREAIRKNFNRQLRDILEAGDTQLGGPFATLLSDGSKPTSQPIASPAPGPEVNSHVGKSTSSANLISSTDFASSMPLPSSLSRTGSPTDSPIRGASSHRRHDNTHGEIMRFKIKQPGASSPHRAGKTLTLPQITIMSLDGASPEATEALLKQSDPMF